MHYVMTLLALLICRGKDCSSNSEQKAPDCILSPRG